MVRVIQVVYFIVIAVVVGPIVLVVSGADVVNNVVGGSVGGSVGRVKDSVL